MLLGRASYRAAAPRDPIICETQKCCRHITRSFPAQLAGLSGSQNPAWTASASTGWKFRLECADIICTRTPNATHPPTAQRTAGKAAYTFRSHCAAENLQQLAAAQPEVVTKQVGRRSPSRAVTTNLAATTTARLCRTAYAAPAGFPHASSTPADFRY